MLRDFNPWWEDKEIGVPLYKRHIFSRVQKYLKTKQIIAIVGLRRVGKTVLMKQVIKELLKKGEKKENICYFLFDELLAQNPEVLEDVLNYYLKTISNKGRKYIFLDEIQKVPFWQDIVKRFYDTRNDLKFVVSGSASLQIKKSKESLAGRMFDFLMPVLTFREFLEMNGLKLGKVRLEYNSIRKSYEDVLHKKVLLEQLFEQYVFKGAFPELARESDEEIIKNYIKSSVIDKIIFEDIPVIFNVKRKDVLYSILEYCSRETSRLLDITNLAKTLGANYQTTKSYLFYLKNAFVVDLVYNYSKSTAKQLRKNKKVHIVHSSISITMARHTREVLSLNELMGRYVETTVFQHAKMLGEKVSFWRTPQKEEVDIVLEQTKILPIEVKYRSSVTDEDAKALLKFLNRFGSNRGIIVTRSRLNKRMLDGKEILFIPVWLFLLAV